MAFFDPLSTGYNEISFGPRGVRVARFRPEGGGRFARFSAESSLKYPCTRGFMGKGIKPLGELTNLLHQPFSAPKTPKIIRKMGVFWEKITIFFNNFSQFTVKTRSTLTKTVKVSIFTRF